MHAPYYEMHRAFIHQGQISTSYEPNASTLTNKVFVRFMRGV